MKYLIAFVTCTLTFVTSTLHSSANTLNNLHQTTVSHSGGTDKCGCHHNRKTGEYHCHTRKKRGGDCPP